MAEHPRLARERATIHAMTQIYCRDRHGLPDGGLCLECAEVFSYATERLARCPYQQAKPTCVRCPIHCYRPEMRERVRVIMRYAGPKMLFHHPYLALRHLMDGRRAPSRPVNRKRNSREHK